jgi:hypothetical protein
MAQLTQTDEFDYWEDQTTHGFAASGITFQGAYTCSNDKTLRCGDCSNGLGAASVNMKVNAGCDTVVLAFLLGWAGGNSAVTVEGIPMGTINTSGTCSWDSVMLVNAAALTADSSVTVVVRDTILGCTGDIQMARLRAFSSPSSPVGLFGAGRMDDALILFPNPSNGPVHWRHRLNDFTEVLISLADPAGRVVFSSKVIARTGAALTFDPGFLPDGLYVLTATTNRSVFTAKLMRRR